MNPDNTQLVNNQLPTNINIDDDPPIFDVQKDPKKSLIRKSSAGPNEVQGVDGVGATSISSNPPTSLSPADGYSVKQGITKVTTKLKLPYGAQKKDVYRYIWQYDWLSPDFFDEDEITQRTISGTSMAVINLWPNDNFYWRVCALYKDGTHGDWSPVMEITTVKTKGPSLSLPGNNSKQKKEIIKFKWSKPTGIPKSVDDYYYYLEVSTDPTFENLDYVFRDLTSNSFQTTDIITEDFPERYYWQVSVFKKEGGESSDYSKVRSFLR